METAATTPMVPGSKLAYRKVWLLQRRPAYHAAHDNTATRYDNQKRDMGGEGKVEGPIRHRLLCTRGEVHQNHSTKQILKNTSICSGRHPRSTTAVVISEFPSGSTYQGHRAKRA